MATLRLNYDKSRLRSPYKKESNKQQMNFDDRDVK